MKFTVIEEVEKRLGMRLPPVLRTVLVSDGTVTKFLEAFYQESIHIQVLRHEEGQIEGRSDFDLRLFAEGKILIREVELQGGEPNRLYAKARSWVRLDHLDAEIQRAFQQKQWGIGELLSDRRVESYREILGYWIDGEGDNQEIGRTYQIWIRSVPTILIEERFSLTVYFQNQ